MTFIVDNKDFSSRVNLSDYRVTPRRISGPAAGTLTNGDHVADIVSIKRDLTLSVEAANISDTKALSSALMKEYVSLIFIDPISGQNYTGTYEPEVGDISMAIDVDTKGRRYWYGFQINFKEK